jgi:hypothetical protein
MYLLLEKYCCKLSVFCEFIIKISLSCTGFLFGVFRGAFPKISLFMSVLFLYFAMDFAY